VTVTGAGVVFFFNITNFTIKSTSTNRKNPPNATNAALELCGATKGGASIYIDVYFT
jgi:hypothetical protein